MYITSSSAVPCEVDIMDIHPLVDTSKDPVTAISEGLLKDKATNNIATPSQFTFGFTPMDSTRFKQLYKVDNHERVFLESGGTHKHSGKIDIN